MTTGAAGALADAGKSFPGVEELIVEHLHVQLIVEHLHVQVVQVVHRAPASGRGKVPR